jgi:negative regulator of flagellin synthesis FlgM
MPHKIDSVSIPPGAALTTGRTVPVARGSGDGAEVRAVAAADSVVLTPDAQSLQRLEQVVAGLPVTDAVRVEQVRAQLQAGSYRVDPQRIADQMVHQEWEFARR